MPLDHDAADLPQACLTDHPADHYLEANCPQCMHAVDAVCPKCGGNVVSIGAGTPHKLKSGVQSVLTEGEFYRRLVLFLHNHRNTKFAICCYLIATGDGFADGVSMTEVAQEWGVGKATVSKQCRYICQYLGIPPSQYMRKEETAAKFKLSNRRPTRTKSTLP